MRSGTDGSHRQAPSNAWTMPRHAIGLATLGTLIVCAGCTTLPSGRGWGADATARPGWERVREAAVTAVKDPWVWAPVAGAAAFQLNGFDRKASNWARDNTPIFGSTGNAERWSNDLRTATGVIETATLLATPSGDDPDEWIANKAKGAAVELAAVGSTSLATTALKKATGRTRPNGANDESFLSGHASSASVSGRLAKINLDSIELGRGTRVAADITIDMTVFGTAWARVEAGAHYPSDVLAGMALGNFFARFVTDAFLDSGARESVALTATDGGAILCWNVRF
jgi:membrane-associated phospholipid phosphatase